MNLKQGLFTCLLLLGCYCLSSAQTPSYPWLDGVVSDNCCTNQTATAYDFGAYSFVYIEANGNCSSGGKLYYEDGTCWCEDADGLSCLASYSISKGSGEVIYNCEGATSFTPFDQFGWLSGVASLQDCGANPSITVYLKEGQHYIYVENSNGLGELFTQTGKALCKDQANYSCRTAYDLSVTNETLSWSCEDRVNTPLKEGVDIILRNTLQDPEEAENTYASLFGAADDAFDEFATLSNTATEFATALAQGPDSGAPFDINGLYSIDFTENSIAFAVLPDESDPFWVNVFGLFPEGKVDRYYFTLSEPHNIKSFTSDNPNLNVRIDSENVIVVELTSGYNLQPGVSFTVNLLEEASPTPLMEGVNVTLRNTLQDPGEPENTYASLFGAADDAFDEFATLSNTEIEFATALAQSPATGAPFDISGLYEIDFTDSSISFKVLPDESDPFWVNVFGLFPEGKVDRYYFTFSEPHNITSFSSDNPNLNVRIDSENEIVVELTEGYELKPNISFMVNLNKDGNSSGVLNTPETLPIRSGPRTETTMGVPHVQIAVELVPNVHEEMIRRIYAIPGIEDQPSVVLSWQGLWIMENITLDKPDALIDGRELGHIHDDGSLHIFLAPERAAEAIEAGWAISHPFAVQGRAGWDGFVMLYTPQSIEELNVTFQLIVDAYNYVTGQELVATDFYD